MLSRMGDVVAQLNASGGHGGQTAPSEPARVAAGSAAWWAPWYSRPIRLIVICGIILLAIVIAATMVLLSDLRDRDLAEKERALESLTSVLAEQIDRSFELIELVQTAVIERMRTLGIASGEDYERRMSGYDTYERLKDAINGLPYIDAIILTDARGKLINFSRSWPIPNVKIPDNDPSAVFASDPRLISFVGKPLRSPATGKWVVSIARKLTGPNSEFLGVVQVAVDLQYFEKSFGAIAIDPDSSIALFRRDGILLARYPRQETAIGQIFPQSRVLKAPATADHSTSRQVGVIDGRERLVSSRSLAHYPVVAVATVTVADALANWKRGAIAMIIAALMIGFVIGGAVFLIVWAVGRKLREQNLQRDTALDNMSQGLAMFDAAARLVVCNERYRQMYDFPPDLAKPGCKLLDLLKYRFATGTFSHDPEEYVRDLPAKIAQGEMAKLVVETGDGRIVTVTNWPMARGGWVATHEDMTEKIRAEKLGEQQKLQLDTALDNMSQGLCMFDAMQRLIICNKRYAELYGLNDEQTKPGSTLRAILEARIACGNAPADHESYIKDRVKEVTENSPYEVTNRLSDGRYIFVVHRPMANGGWVATHEDITERKQAEAEIEESRNNLARAETMANLGHYKFEQGSKALTWSENLYRIFDKSPETFTPTLNAVLELIHPDDRPVLEQYRRDVMTGFDLPPITERLVRGDGQIIYIENWARPLRASDGSVIGMFGTIQDVTDRKQAEAQISYIARHDPLTGMANRAVLLEKMEEALARLRRGQEPFAILLLDLDGFKHVNDTLGHTAGDELLKKLGQRLTFLLRETDILARLGGDEFAIIQSGGANQREAAIALAVRVLEVVAEPFDVGGDNVTIGTSIGIALAPEDAASSGELLQKADLALYRAKSEGRNNFRFFDAEMSKRAIERHQLLNDMRVALTRKEFELYYQPVFDAKTRRPCVAEALVRWRHPSQGLIPPDRFIPLAEDAGLMEPLGEWILEKACRDAVAWPEHIKVAVNLSAVQFRSGKLFDVILCVLVESGLPPERLELEITESVLMQDTKSNSAMLQQLKNIGVSIALDDFGTGYSSLSYLTTFPFDKIKIDKSFTQGLTNNGGCAAGVASVLMLARVLDMTVTAEGVETNQQFELLRASGVHQMQGYLFARPGPVAELDFSALEQKGRGVAAA